MQEVVMATATDLAKLPYSDLAEGFYLVGSGNTGLAGSLATISVIYGVTVVSSAFLMKKPAPGYVPEGWTPPATASGGSERNVNVATVMKTPQFWLLFSTSTLLCTGGMGLMSVAKPMIGEVFSSSVPHLVTASFASSYLLVSRAQCGIFRILQLLRFYVKSITPNINQCSCSAKCGKDVKSTIDHHFNGKINIFPSNQFHGNF